MKRLLLLVIFGLCGCGKQAAPPASVPKAVAAVAQPVVLPEQIAAFYAERGHRPLWVAGRALKPEAETLLRRLATAQADGLDPGRYGVAEIEEAVAAAATGDRNALARADLLLTRGYSAYARDLRGPPHRLSMRYIDAGLAPEAPEPQALLAAASAGEIRLNPLYEALRRGYTAWRRANPRPAPGEEALIEANLARVRAIPPRQGRYIIVDTGSARLWMIDGDTIDGPMRVIVGKPGMQTPELAGLIRYVALNPYWNMPPDLARDRARRVLREGPAFLARERLQILSDWGDRPRVLKPSQVDWRAVASGKVSLRLRQLPGGANVMGAIKFMLPNDLGIYLHDFPDKSLFARDDRRLSSGCVRVEDAPRLARWLFGGTAPSPRGAAPEQHVDLPEPVPVYMTYLTVLPDPGRGLAFQSDAYRRDRIQLSTR
jgi:L,D-transpeptidase YcbB